jgi:hypothetical protein
VTHVDIVKSEPLAGSERVLARVTLEHGSITIEAEDRDYWEEALTSGVAINPTESPEEFLAAVSERFNGTYVFTTEPHDDSDCPYAQTADRLDATPA